MIDSSTFLDIGQESLFALPPTYLSVAGFEDCLGIDSNSMSHTVRCLPKQKPSGCLENSWSQIKTEFDGSQCPEPEVAQSISHIFGHEKCIKRREEPSHGHCVTLQPEPDCLEETHSKILNTIFTEEENQRNINKGNHATSLDK